MVFKNFNEKKKLILINFQSQVVDVEWNSSGTTIFCGYGRYDHESVCTHKGALATWNIDRLKMDPNKPDNMIETASCVSSIATHPEHPAVVAVGFFNGLHNFIRICFLIRLD